MQPDATFLLEKLGLHIPLIGFYDAPDPHPFEPLVEPKQGTRACVFAFYRNWLAGKTLHLTQDAFGCPGAGYWLCAVETRPRDDMVRFLVDEEGLKASHSLMNQWLDYRRGYRREHPHLLIGPLHSDQYAYLKTVTFLVNPDQLGLLMIGTQYYRVPDDPSPVLAPFGSGCSQLIIPFDDLNIPQAVVGATDIAMRRYLDPDRLAFTVTRPMFEQLCALGEETFLSKPFWSTLRKARE